jgi:hypothetical protein
MRSTDVLRGRAASVADADDVIHYWPDPFTAAVATAAPSSKFFSEFVAYAMRVELDASDHFFAGADLASVLAELGVTVHQLAASLHVPHIYLHAVARGWHRLGLRGWALVAEALDVPMAAFLLDQNGNPRDDVRRYNAYRMVAPRVTILGGAAGRGDGRGDGDDVPF